MKAHLHHSTTLKILARPTKLKPLTVANVDYEVHEELQNIQAVYFLLWVSSQKPLDTSCLKATTSNPTIYFSFLKSLRNLFESFISRLLALTWHNKQWAASNKQMS